MIGYAVVSPEEIDRINILQASLLAMARAVAHLAGTAGVCPGLPARGRHLHHSGRLPQKTLVKGESKSASIAAASIIAKVVRDRLMAEYHVQYPRVQFPAEQGVSDRRPPAGHRALGPCAIHRRTFKGVREFVDGQPPEKNPGSRGYGERHGRRAANFPCVRSSARPERLAPRPKRTLGESGEEIAAAFLQGLGYIVLTRNYRKRFGEIDIVAEEGDTLVFVEVKTRSSAAFGSPLEAVDARKQRRMARAALAYLSAGKLHDRAARFDVVAVRLQPQDRPLIEHIRNAFDLAVSEAEEWMERLLGITMGCPVGIGPEIILRFFADPPVLPGYAPVVLGDTGVLARTATLLGLPGVIVPWAPGESLRPDTIPVCSLSSLRGEDLRWGRPDARDGPGHGRLYRGGGPVDPAGELCRDRHLSDQQEGPASGRLPLSRRTPRCWPACPGRKPCLMMMAGSRLRVVLVTIHEPPAPGAGVGDQGKGRRVHPRHCPRPAHGFCPGSPPDRGGGS